MTASGPSPGKSPGAASSGRIAKGLIVLAILAVVNLWQATREKEGPDPAEEAMHSPQEAVEHCRAAVDSAFADREPSVVGTFAAGYLQGGEYEVMGTVELVVGRIRARRGVVCELQFRPEFGWRVEHIELGSR